MLGRDTGMSVPIICGFRQRDFFHMGRGLLPLLAVMLLDAAQLALAQGGLAVTVNPRVLEVTEESGIPGRYTVVLDTEPSEDVTITVVGAPTTGADITVSSTSLTFTAPSTPGGTDGNWNTAQNQSDIAGSHGGQQRILHRGADLAADGDRKSGRCRCCR